MKELFNPEVKITDLTIEAPQKSERSPFQPERDITRTDWLEITNMIRNRYVQGLMSTYWTALARATLLFPERREAIVHPDSYTESLRQHLSTLKANESPQATPEELLGLIANVRTLYPDLVDYHALLPVFLEEFRPTPSNVSINLVADLNRAFPNTMRSLIAGNWSGFMMDIANVEARLADPPSSSWNPRLTYFSSLAHLRLADPTKIKELVVDEDRWDMLRQELNRLHSWEDFLKLAASAKILAAEKVVVNDAGVTLILPGDVAVMPDTTAPLPEQRKY